MCGRTARRSSCAVAWATDSYVRCFSRTSWTNNFSKADLRSRTLRHTFDAQNEIVYQHALQVPVTAHHPPSGLVYHLCLQFDHLWLTCVTVRQSCSWYLHLIALVSQRLNHAVLFVMQRLEVVCIRILLVVDNPFCIIQHIYFVCWK